MALHIYKIESKNDYQGSYYDPQVKIKAKPIIYLYCRDDNGTKSVKKINGFKPYFFIEAEKELPVSINDYIVGIENKEYVSIKGEKCKKIYLHNPTNTKFVREECERRNIKTFEDDVSFPLRFLIDEKEPLEKQGIDLRAVDSARRLYLDIETTTTLGFPEPKEAREAITCMSCYDSYTKKYHIFMWHPDYEKITNIKVDGIIIVPFYNEEQMLRSFLDYYQRVDPDMILGWNVAEFDIAYIINRLKNLKMNPGELSLHATSSRGGVWMWESEDGNWLNPQINGVVLFDLMKFYRNTEMNEKSSYSLDNIAKEELKECKNCNTIMASEEVCPKCNSNEIMKCTGKIPVKNHEKLWREEPEKMVKYNIRDIELCIQIENKKEIINFVDGLRRMVGCNFADFHYFSRLTDLLILRRARNDGIVLPSKPRSNGPYIPKDKREARFKGAEVFISQGVYDDVCALDLKTLYPLIIKGMNISYETVRDDGSGQIKIGNETYDTTKVGFLPSVIDELLLISKKYKAKRKESVGTDDYKKYASLYECSKFIVLSLYGVQGSDNFRIYDVRNAANITRIGREIITLSKKLIEDEGHKVILIDTDSCYTKLLHHNETIESQINEGKRLSKILNDAYSTFAKDHGALSHYFEIELEKIYKRILIATKKRYSGHKVWEDEREVDEITISGFQAIKSDSAKQTKFIQTNILKMIIGGKDFDEVKEYMLEEAIKVNKNDFKSIDIGLPAVINQAEYVSNLPKVRGMKWSNKYLKTNFKIGDKPLLIYVKSKNNETDSILFEYDYQFDEACKLGIEIDKERMIDRNIIMPMRTIFEAAGWNLDKVKAEIFMKISGQQTLNIIEKEVI